MEKPLDYTISSGNVFADMGLPDAEELMLKSRLAIQIRQIIEEKGLTTNEAAHKIGITEPQIIALFNGRLTEFTSDQLLNHLNRLVHNIKTHTDHPVISGIGWGILLGAISGVVVSFWAAFLYSWARDIIPDSPLIYLLLVIPLPWAIGMGCIFWRKQAYFGIAFGATAFIFSAITLLLLGVVQMLGGPT